MPKDYIAEFVLPYSQYLLTTLDAVKIPTAKQLAVGCYRFRNVLYFGTQNFKVCIFNAYCSISSPRQQFTISSLLFHLYSKPHFGILQQEKQVVLLVLLQTLIWLKYKIK